MGKKNILSVKKQSIKKKEQRRLKLMLQNIDNESKNVKDPINSIEQADCNSFETGQNETFNELSSDEESETVNDDHEDSEKDINAKKDMIFDLNLEDFLKVWSVKFFINKDALNILLKYINNKFDKKIPKDYRKLLQTPRHIPLKSVEPGNYVHIGIRKHVDAFLNKVQIVPSELKIRLNIDGLPLYKDSKMQEHIMVNTGRFLWDR